MIETKILKKYIFIFIALLLTLGSSLYTIDQRQQALVLQLGEPVKVVRKPGLKIKIPFLQNVIFFDNRILDLAVEDQEVIASDQKRLIINAFTKFKIKDPLKFYTTVRNQYGINSRLSAILDSSLRQVIGEIPLNELLTDNRAKIMEDIKEIVSRESKIFGIEIVDVRIVRGDLPKENSEAIFARMQTDREKEAREIRAKGAEEAQKIKAEADKQRTIIIAEAQRKANLMKGLADSEANKIYANSYGKDPEFADFYRSMNAYKESLKIENTKMLISPDNEFFKYFGK